jgi:hypothetical protein
VLLLNECLLLLLLFISLWLSPETFGYTILHSTKRTLKVHILRLSSSAPWYNAELRTGWSGVRVPAGAGNFSLHHCEGSIQPPIQWVQGAPSWGVNLTTHLHLVPRSRMRGAIHPLHQYAFMVCCTVEAQGQLYLYLHPHHILGPCIKCRCNLSSSHSSHVGIIDSMILKRHENGETCCTCIKGLAVKKKPQTDVSL